MQLHSLTCHLRNFIQNLSAHFKSNKTSFQRIGQSCWTSTVKCCYWGYVLICMIYNLSWQTSPFSNWLNFLNFGPENGTYHNESRFQLLEKKKIWEEAKGATKYGDNESKFFTNYKQLVKHTADSLNVHICTLYIDIH